MIAVVRGAGAIVLLDREFLLVNAIVGVAALAATGLLLHYGSFARALAAFGLAPAI